MGPLLFLLLLFGTLPLVGVWISIKGTRAATQQRAGLYRRFAKLAPALGGALDERDMFGAQQSRVPCQVGGHSCEARLGWFGEGFALQLEVFAPDVDAEVFHARWQRSLARYLLADPAEQIVVRWRGGRREMVLTGPGRSLRDVFRQGPSGMAAALFDEPEGDRRWKLEVGARRVLLECSPDLRSFPRLPERLAALVTLVNCVEAPARPVHGDPVRRMPSSTSGKLKAAGTAVVSIQAGQRCAYCHEDLAGALPSELKTCGACSSPMHADCLAEHGGCCTLGCRNDPRTRGRGRA